MQRKLIQQGLGGMTIYLPKEWIDAHKMSKGDLISIDDSEGKLILSPTQIKKKRETTIELHGLTESLIRTLITNTYRAGYDIINVKFDKKDQLKILQDIVEKRLAGFEITKTHERNCLVESVTEPAEDQFDSIFQKLFSNIDTLIDITINNCSTNKSNEDEDLEVLEQRINKYDNFCRRILTKRRFDNKSGMLLSFIVLITHGQRELYHLNKFINKKIKYSLEIKDLAHAIKEMWSDIKVIYATKDQSRFENLHELEKKYLLKEGYHNLKKSKGDESIVLFRLLSSLRNFYQANSPLAGIVF